MKKIVKMSIAAAMMMSVSSVSASAADGMDLVSNVKVKGEIRPRYEMVDQDNATPNANAFTNRLTIGASADLGGTDWLSAYAEMTNVSSLNDNYRDLAKNNALNHSIVADPEQTRLTQSYINVKLDKTLLRVGRQVINLDNQRFIGSVNWRQMPQTVDAYLLKNNSVKGLDLSAAYITQVNTIFADGGPKVDSYDTRTLLLNASYKISDALKATAYAYMIGSTHDTYGLSLTGKMAVSDGVKINYRAEYATQDDSSMDNSGMGEGKADADYYNLKLGMNMGGILAGVNYEVQSGASGNETTFKTPLGTNHAFNGWADMFLSTPTEGLEDMNVMVGYKAKGFGLAKVVYHDFQSDVGSTDYGTEVDFIYKNKVPGVKNLSGMVKVAAYDADDFGVDTEKLWLMLSYKFASK